MSRDSGRLLAALQVLGLVVLSAAGVALVLFVVHALPWTVTWDVWNVLTAVGTVGATLVAVALALRAWVGEKNSTARVVSAWVTDDYRPRDDGRSYQRTAVVHVANEGEQPVFDARVNVVLGRHRTPVGPLSVPMPISVIPPHREFTFDISTALLAHPNSWNPLATLYFTDPRGRRWLRDADGVLKDVSRSKSGWSKSQDAGDVRQLGNPSLFNPMTIALAFLAGLRDADTNPEDLAVTLAPEAAGWAEVDWAKTREQLDHYQPTSMVDYPAPRIARVKLSGDPSLEGRTVEGEGLELADSMFMTLTLHPDRGWRIFSIGDSVPPDAIDFGGTLGEEMSPSRSDLETETHVGDDEASSTAGDPG